MREDGSAAAAAAAAPAAATGGAAILAKLRAQQAAKPSTPPATETFEQLCQKAPAQLRSKAVFVYGSQMGTGEEIARSLHAGALERGYKADCMSLNELGVHNISKTRTPVVVLVASSTGDGDPPDNATTAYNQIRRKQPDGLFQGVRFTLLGLGDSNYTRFMACPRVFRTRFTELGAKLFYPFAEVDEVDGLENGVDPWCENIWPALHKALAAADGDLDIDLVEPAALEVAAKPAAKAAAAPAAPASAASTTPPATKAGEDAEGASFAKASASSATTPPAAAASSNGDHVLAVEPSFMPQGQLPPGSAASSSRPVAPVAVDEAEVGSQPSVTSPGTSLSLRVAEPTGVAYPTPQHTAGEVGLGGLGQTSPSGKVSPAPTGFTSMPSTPGLSRMGTPMSGQRSRPDSAAPSSEAVAASKFSKPMSVHFPVREETVVPRRPEQEYGLNAGLAPIGADLKGAPALLPCRIKVSWEQDLQVAAKVAAAEAAQPDSRQLAYRDPAGMYSADKPFWAQLTDARLESAFWSDRKVLHFELDLADSGLAPEPGDAIGVMAANEASLVSGLLKRLPGNLKASQVLLIKPADEAAAAAGTKLLPHLPCPCTLGYALTWCVDLTSPTKKSVLRVLAEHCSDAAEKRTLMFLVSKAGKDAYTHEVLEHQPSLLDLLERFKSCSPPLDVLLDALPPLQPRLYSITNAQAGVPGKAQVALSVVKFKTRYGTRHGVASTWLERLAAPLLEDGCWPNNGEPPRVRTFLRKAMDFKPPKDLSKPLIMVGPGTGVAPFRGFLQQRRADIKAAFPKGFSLLNPPPELGESWLFFGCRREDEDFLYRQDLEDATADGTLSHLMVAFSRAQAEKVYVQNLIQQHAEELAKLIVQGGAHVYVCGDGAKMAKDVNAALQAMLVQYAGMSAEQAAEYMRNMAQELRYVRDVWS